MDRIWEPTDAPEVAINVDALKDWCSENVDNARAEQMDGLSLWLEHPCEGDEVVGFHVVAVGGEYYRQDGVLDARSKSASLCDMLRDFVDPYAPYGGANSHAQVDDVRERARAWQELRREIDELAYRLEASLPPP